MSKPRIAILTPRGSGKAETFIQNHIDRLPFEVTVIHGGYFPWLNDNFPENGRKALVSNLSDQFFKKTTTVSSYKRNRLVEILKKNKIQAVLAEYVLSGAAVIDVCSELGIPVLSTGLGYELSVYDVLEKNKTSYQNYLSKAYNTVVVAQNMKETLVGLGGDKDKITWSPAGPSQDFFDIKPDLSAKTFFCLGRFVDKKAPYLVVLSFAEVLSKHPDAQLVMAGDGPLLQTCIDIASALGIEKSVQFVGRINQTEQREYLSSCTAFVQHSKVAPDGDSEGTPVAILEASAAGVPIISTRHSGIVDVVVHEKTGWLGAEGDCKAMTQFMIQSLDNLENSQSMGIQGREFVKENFSLDRHLDTITRLITAAING